MNMFNSKVKIRTFASHHIQIFQTHFLNLVLYPSVLGHPVYQNSISYLCPSRLLRSNMFWKQKPFCGFQKIWIAVLLFRIFFYLFRCFVLIFSIYKLRNPKKKKKNQLSSFDVHSGLDSSPSFREHLLRLLRCCCPSSFETL